MIRLKSLISRHWLGILGLSVMFVYLTSAFRLINYPQKLFTILLLAIAPVAIVGVFSV